MKLHVLTIAALALLAAVPALAAQDIDSVRFLESSWAGRMIMLKDQGPSLLPGDFDVKMDPPPANSSAETRADLDALLAMQDKERTPEQIDRIYKEAKAEGAADMFAMNGLFDPATHPQAKLLLDTVDHDVIALVLREKWKYQRARPTYLEPKLTAIIPIPPHASYPSGHATQSYAAALVLEALDPARKDAYEAVAMDIAHRREIAGVHYPADSAAGRQVAQTIVAALMMRDDVRAMAEAAKQEFEQQLEMQKTKEETQ